MKKQFKAFLLAILLCVFLGGGASAQDWCNSIGTWWFFYNGTYSPYKNNPCHGWTAAGGGHVVGVNMWWNQAGRDGVQNYVAQGKRYTHDMTDLNDNLSATGTYASNFPGIYIDFDDDDGNGEWEEAEATVENAAFPVVDRKYWLHFWFSWNGAAGNAGNVALTPAISEELWWTSDKWDTHKFDRGLNVHYTKTGNLFESPSELPSAKIFKENENETKFERRKFVEPLSIDDFRQQVDAAGIRVRGYALEYEVESEDGPQIVTVGLVPTADEFVPSATLADVISSLPDKISIQRLRGVVSYYYDSASTPMQREK